jgi:hypothetical protein
VWKEANRKHSLDRERSLPAFCARLLKWIKQHKREFAQAACGKADFVVQAAAEVASNVEVLKPQLWKDREFILSLVAALSA